MDEGDVRRHPQLLHGMPAGVVDEHRRVCARRQLRGDVLEQQGHRRDGDVARHQRRPGIPPPYSAPVSRPRQTAPKIAADRCRRSLTILGLMPRWNQQRILRPFCPTLVSLPWPRPETRPRCARPRRAAAAASARTDRGCASACPCQSRFRSRRSAPARSGRARPAARSRPHPTPNPPPQARWPSTPPAGLSSDSRGAPCPNGPTDRPSRQHSSGSSNPAASGAPSPQSVPRPPG